MTHSVEDQIKRAMEVRHGHGLSTDIDGLIEVLDQLAVPVSSDVLDGIVRRWGARSGEVVIPRQLRAFVSALADQRKPERVVDPWCNLGQLVTAVAERLHAANLRGVTPRADQLRVLAHVEGHVEWTTGRVDSDPALIGTSNDLVVCAPPFNARADAAHGSGHGQGELATLLLEAACASLSPNGEALFVLAPIAWTRGGEGGWRDSLAAIGCSVKACYWLPSGTFQPQTAIPAVLVHAVRAAQGEMFVAQLPQDEDGIRIVLANLIHRRDAPDARLGRWLEVDAFRSMPQLLAHERVHDVGPRSGRAQRLGDIGTVSAWDPEQAGAEAVLIPAEGPSRPATVASSATDLKGRYLAIDAAEEFAVPEYLARYFSSELGQLSREAASAGTAVPRLSVESVTEMSVYLPDIEVQRAVVDTHARILTLMNELRELNERLWAKPKTHVEVRAALAKVNHEDRFEAWVETLPFPLATILWLYLTQRTSKDRVETLLHFFEAYTQFWATALLSMFLRDPIQREERQGRIQEVLLKQRQSIELAGFGTWRTLVELLTKEGRQLQSSDEGFSYVKRQAALADARFLEVLLSKEALGVLSRANSLRNTFKGHGGIVTDAVARDQLLRLTTLLAELRQVVGERWQEYLLCRVGTLEYRSGLYIAQVDRVVGTRTPFTSDSIELTGPAESGRLHLVGAGSRDALPLLPLVKVIPSPC